MILQPSLDASLLHENAFLPLSLSSLFHEPRRPLKFPLAYLLDMDRVRALKEGRKEFLF